MLTDKPCRPMLLYQDDVCDACQLLIKGGLKDENIIYITKLYSCLMCYLLRKDYTRDDINVDNFLVVLFGNQTALTRYQKDGNSDPNDHHIYMFYSDHGGFGVLDTKGGDVVQFEYSMGTQAC
ncbi:hypothetical protein H5410_012804 [Solanum commersonii]|uniref:Uncharacterized protein n=1 Tax=Solanum commersonii TaxID=4109 RepID=A0A9J6ATP0_SOLCO|nr:hypothetical protein H5410_012804 [Solanum commersonii]